MDIPLRIQKGKGPLYPLIRDGIRDLVVKRTLPPGSQLPPVRVLARQLGVNPLTVFRAYKELTAMGYLETEVGIRTFVPERLPEEFAATRAGRREAASSAPPALLATLSPALRVAPGRPVGFSKERNWRVDFVTAAGDPRLFPVRVWKKLHGRRLEERDSRLSRYGSPQGETDLIEILRTQVLPARGISAGPSEIFIAQGGLEGIHLFLRAILKPGEQVLVEEPGWPHHRATVSLLGGRIRPVALDGQGLRLEGFRRALARDIPRAAILTPSHQLPTGVTLDYGRRLEILRAAAGRATWIVEDDYDHEFHYDSPPLPSLKSLDRTGQVAYMGTFSKVTFPGLRLGFVVASPEVVSALSLLRFRTQFFVPPLGQRVMADFIRQGHYDMMVRRLRRTYLRRRDRLVSALRRHLPQLSFQVPQGGIRLWARLPRGTDGEALTERLMRRGVRVQTGSRHFAEKPDGEYLHLGFAHPDEREIEEGVRAIAQAMKRRGTP